MSVYSLDSLENEPISILHVPDASKTSYKQKQQQQQQLVCSRITTSVGQNNRLAFLATRLENAPCTVGVATKRDCKKLGNNTLLQQLPSSSKQRRPGSYLELYRRKFSAAPLAAAPLAVVASESLENSRVGLSTCGSKHYDENDDEGEDQQQQHHRLKDLPVVISREMDQKLDDHSEMSFYRRLLEHEATFRPYTLSDYRQIRAKTALVLPKSLPPDSHSLRIKQEALVRRRSYGDAASAVNRRRISSSKLNPSKNRSSNSTEVVSVVEQPSRHVSKRQSCSAAIVSTVNASSITTTTTKTDTRISKVSTISAKKKKKKKEEVKEDEQQPSLHELRKRHFNEKRMIDQLVKRTLLLA